MESLWSHTGQGLLIRKNINIVRSYLEKNGDSARDCVPSTGAIPNTQKTVPSCKSWILCSHQTVIYYHRNSSWLPFSRIVWREERLNTKVYPFEWGGERLFGTQPFHGQEVVTVTTRI